MIIYRLDLSSPPEKRPLAEGRCEIAAGFTEVLRGFRLWVRAWGWKAAVKTALKVFTKRRIFFYSVLNDGTIAQSGWANLGFCRYYPVERKDVVLGTLLTHPEHRSRGFSTAAKSQVISYLYNRGYMRFYSDTSRANIASQRTSEKLGFQKIAENSVASEPS